MSNHQKKPKNVIPCFGFCICYRVYYKLGQSEVGTSNSLWFLRYSGFNFLINADSAFFETCFFVVKSQYLVNGMRFQPEIWYIDNLPHGGFSYQTKNFFRVL